MLINEVIDDVKINAETFNNLRQERLAVGGPDMTVDDLDDYITRQWRGKAPINKTVMTDPPDMSPASVSAYIRKALHYYQSGQLFSAPRQPPPTPTPAPRTFNFPNPKTAGSSVEINGADYTYDLTLATWTDSAGQDMGADNGQILNKQFYITNSPYYGKTAADLQAQATANPAERQRILQYMQIAGVA